MPPKPSLIATIIATLTIGAGVVLYTLQNGDVNICDAQNTCHTYTAQEYTDLRHELGAKYQADQPMTFEEYKLFVAVVDAEIDKRGGIQVANVTGNGAIKQKIVDMLNQ